MIDTGNDVPVHLHTVVAYVRKPCTCPRSPLTAPGFLAHDGNICPVYYALDDRVKLAWFLVTRTGASRIEGGEGVSWACTCEDGDEDRPSCKHINDLFASNIKELDNAAAAQDHVHDTFRGGSVILLTPYGGSILHAVWAANALRENPAGVQAQGISGGTGMAIPSGLNPPIQIYRGPQSAPQPQPWPLQPAQHQPWVSPSTPRRRWWHTIWPFNKR